MQPVGDKMRNIGKRRGAHPARGRARCRADETIPASPDWLLEDEVRHPRPGQARAYGHGDPGGWSAAAPLTLSGWQRGPEGYRQLLRTLGTRDALGSAVAGSDNSARTTATASSFCSRKARLKEPNKALRSDGALRPTDTLGPYPDPPPPRSASRPPCLDVIYLACRGRRVQACRAAAGRATAPLSADHPKGNASEGSGRTARGLHSLRGLVARRGDARRDRALLIAVKSREVV